MAHSRVKACKIKLIYRDLSRYKAYGLAWRKRKLIELDPNQSPRELFLTAFHEASHIMLPDLKEQQVRRLEQSVGKLLWKVASRRKRS